MFRPDVAAGKLARARAWLADAERGARTLRGFLAAVADEAGL